MVRKVSIAVCAAMCALLASAFSAANALEAEPFFYEKTFNVGDTAAYHIKSDTEMDLKMRNLPRGAAMASSMHMDFNMESEIEQTVAAVSDREIQVNVTYKSIKVKVAMPGIMELDYDSDDPKDAAKARLEEYRAFTTMVGKTLVVFMSPEGEFVKIEGVAEVANEAVIGVPLDRRDQIQENIRQFGHNLGVTIAQGFKFLPAEPVQISDEWTQTTITDVPMIGEVLSAMRYTFKGAETWGQRLAVSFDSQVMDNKMEKLVIGPIPGGVKILRTSSPPSNGSILFDPAAGDVLEKELVTNLYMELGFRQPPDPSLRDVTMDLLFNVHTVQTLIENGE